MGWFKKDSYKRDGKGKWKLVKSELESAPTDYGRWSQSCNLEKKSTLGERSYVDTGVTRTGINRKVTQVRTYFSKDEKVVRNLITTSSRLPKRYKQK